MQLLFVYNANSGAGHALLDALHKLLSPATYSCTLCSLTYGATRMRPEWKAFLQTLPLPVVFLYRDQLVDLYPHLAALPLPAVFTDDTTGTVAPLVTAAEFRHLDLSGLMALVQARVAGARPPATP
ncbi:hypothetical protein [Hymenobacter busanensis]|nr:hypothetical protein [Hymenobacter busanensis]